jgi:hypothetical protein
MRRRDFGLRIVSLALVCILAACSSADCIRQVARVTNPGGNTAATLEVSECGGATVGYVTDLKLSRTSPGRSEETKYVWTVKGKVSADLRWTAPNQLEVSYHTELPQDHTVLQLHDWFDTKITYRRHK